MTNFTTRMTIAAAALVAAAGVASAQTMRAEIPFTFRANGVVMAAGSYRITLDPLGGAPILYLFNVEGHRSVTARALAPHDPPKAWQQAATPLLSFACGAKLCSLAGLWTGDQAPAYHFAVPKLGRDETVRTALIELRYTKGD